MKRTTLGSSCWKSNIGGAFVQELREPLRCLF